MPPRELGITSSLHHTIKSLNCIHNRGDSPFMITSLKIGREGGREGGRERERESLGQTRSQSIDHCTRHIISLIFLHRCSALILFSPSIVG